MSTNTSIHLIGYISPLPLTSSADYATLLEPGWECLPTPDQRPRDNPEESSRWTKSMAIGSQVGGAPSGPQVIKGHNQIC